MLTCMGRVVGGDHVAAELTGPDGSLITASVADRGSGVYTIVFTVNLAGGVVAPALRALTLCRSWVLMCPCDCCAGRYKCSRCQLHKVRFHSLHASI